MTLHSFHYLYPHSYFLIKHPEKYARDIGLELEKQGILNGIVIESPKYRNYNKLRVKYDAKWVLDLHSNDGEMKVPKFYQELRKKHDFGKQEKYLSMLFIGGRSTSDRIFPDIFYKLSDWSKKKYPKKSFDIDIAGHNVPYGVIGVELFPHNSKSESIEFVKSLMKFLYLV